MEIPTADQWKDLFYISELLRKKEPWKRFPEELIFEIKAADSDDTFFVSVHGYEEEIKGFSVYRGLSDVQKYFNILDGGDDVSFGTIVGNQSCVSVICSEREQMGPGDFTAMEEAGFVPVPEAESHIFFRNYKPGFAPWYIDAEEAALLTRCLTLWNELLIALGEDAEIPNAGEKMIFRNGDSNPEIVPLRKDFRFVPDDIIKDDFFIARLKRLKRNGRSIELDVCYLSNPVGSQLGPIPFFPKMCVIADCDEGYIADQCIFEETSEFENAFFEFLSKYLNENGLPLKIKYRDNVTGYLLRDTCEKLRIALVPMNSLDIIDDFIEMISGGMPM